ncbi:hypothetical protein D3C80_1149160 [compost metagenome]
MLGDLVVFGRGQGLIQAVRVRADREDGQTAVRIRAERLPQEEVIGRAGDDLGEADLRPVFGVVEGELIGPFVAVAEHALDPRRDVERSRAIVGEAPGQAAHFLGRKLALPALDQAGVGVEEEAVLAAVLVLIEPGLDIAEQLQIALAELEVEEELGPVVQGVADGRIGVHALALAQDGAVADRFVAAAEVPVARAVGVVGRAAI